MPKSRLQKTLADYIVIAIIPALIMLLVGSLVFFLLAIGYDGRFAGRLHWILGWFVLAIVLVARIAIEQGPEHARVYGLALAGATSLVMLRFVDEPWIAIPLLAVIWWCANRLTWDSTLVDENEDASGEGLLQHAGIDDDAPGAADEEQTQSALPDDDSDDRIPIGAGSASSVRSKEKQPHAPGLWILYFSLLALPVFGIGQLFIPASNEDGRESAFRLLLVYVVSGLALLLTTSFLGLRRYLRQRRIRMPAPIAAIWLLQGSLIILAIMAACILLPRPNATYSATALLDRIAEREQEASRHAQLGGEGVGQEGRRIGEGESTDEDDAPAHDSSEQNGEADRTDGDAGRSDRGSEQDNDQQRQGQSGRRGEDRQNSDRENVESEPDNDQQQQGQSGRRAEDRQSSAGENAESDGGRRDGGQSGEESEGDADQQSDQRGENRSDRNAEADLPEEQQSQPPPLTLSRITAWLATFGKWLIYAVMAAMLLWYVIRNRAALLDSLRQVYLWFLGLFGLNANEPDAAGMQGDVPEAARAARPFAAFENPFTTGRAARMKPETLVVYTFEALQAWAREHGIERPIDQTPLEFVRTVAARHPELASEVALAGRLYARVAYASGSPSRGQVDGLEKLWRGLSWSAVSPVSAIP